MRGKRGESRLALDLTCSSLLPFAHSSFTWMFFICSFWIFLFILRIFSKHSSMLQARVECFTNYEVIFLKSSFVVTCSVAIFNTWLTLPKTGGRAGWSLMDVNYIDALAVGGIFERAVGLWVAWLKFLLVNTCSIKFGYDSKCLFTCYWKRGNWNMCRIFIRKTNPE